MDYKVDCVRHGSYVMLLVVMAVVMAVALSAGAIAFDKYVIKSDDRLHIDLQEVTSDIIHGNMLNTMIAQFQQLV